MKRFVVLAIALCISGTVYADAGRGKQLVEQHCTKCHDNSVYTRKDHFVTSREALVNQVTRCSMNTGAKWSEQDTNDVVDYLNSTFYKFK